MLSGAVVVPYLAVSFSVYDHLRAQLSDSRQSRHTWWHPLAKVGMGATAGVVAQASAPSPVFLLSLPNRSPALLSGIWHALCTASKPVWGHLHVLSISAVFA